MVHQFTFKRFEKALRHRVVPAVAFSTAPAARSYFAPQVDPSTESGIQCRRIVHGTGRPARSDRVAGAMKKQLSLYRPVFEGHTPRYHARINGSGRPLL